MTKREKMVLEARALLWRMLHGEDIVIALPTDKETARFFDIAQAELKKLAKALKLPPELLSEKVGPSEAAVRATLARRFWATGR